MFCSKGLMKSEALTLKVFGLTEAGTDELVLCKNHKERMRRYELYKKISLAGPL